ncbi:hypothetical protein DPMN_045506 [Dreissena polymorpha]|uniref:Uncharacterized protein n=1 Tax=Dreissena polymorpha TaxID=45954 RepID=A0A9D4HZS4_DREPO|nr:hypothetical protein DPMN_045506 [Dreissena polymorpha]
MTTMVEGMIKTSVDTISERLNKETAIATNKLFDSTIGKLKSEHKDQDRLINEMQLTIVTIRNEIQQLTEKLQESVTVDVTKLLQQQGTVKTNSDHITALQIIVEALGKKVVEHSRTLVDLSTLGAHNTQELSGTSNYCENYLKRLIIPYLMETYPRIMAKLYNNQIGLYNAVNSLHVSQGMRPVMLVHGQPSLYQPDTGPPKDTKNFDPIMTTTKFKYIRVNPDVIQDTIKTDSDAEKLLTQMRRTMVGNVPVLNPSWTPLLQVSDIPLNVTDKADTAGDQGSSWQL